MSDENLFLVAGVDGCKAGWAVTVASVTKVADSKRCAYRLQRFLLAATFADVLSKATNCKLVCVDIPIGLSNGSKPRECDVAARKLLGGRRASSVFPAPIRPCLCAKDYKTACDISFEHTGKKLSKQSFALLARIRQVDDLMAPQLQHRVREIHPEISFCALNRNKPLQQYKKTVPGQAQRHKLLQRIFTDMDSILAHIPPRGYVMDDAFDALVAAWTAGQAVMGKAATLPKNPDLDSKGLRMEILYPSG